METRPEIGARVRVLARAGVKDQTGQHGVVVAHHADGVAFRVRLDGGREIVCDPICCNAACQDIEDDDEDDDE